MSITLRRVTLTDLTVFQGEHSLEFPTTGLIRLEGVNRDTGGSVAVGKTSVFDAIAWVLGCGRVSAAELKPDYLEKPKTRASLDLGTPKGVAELTRGTKSGWVLGDDVVTNATTLNARINGLFGLSPETLYGLYYREQRRGSAFADLPDARKKGYLGEILGLDKIDGVTDAAQAAAKTAQTEVDALEARLTTLKGVAKPAPLEPQPPDLSEADLRAAELTRALGNLKARIAELGPLAARETEGARAQIERINAETAAEIAPHVENLAKAKTALAGARTQAAAAQKSAAEYRATAARLRVTLQEIDALETTALALAEAETAPAACFTCGSTITQAKLQEITGGRSLAQTIAKIESDKQDFVAVAAKYGEIFGDPQEWHQDANTALEFIGEVWPKRCDIEYRELTQAVDEQKSVIAQIEAEIAEIKEISRGKIAGLAAGGKPQSEALLETRKRAATTETSLAHARAEIALAHKTYEAAVSAWRTALGEVQAQAAAITACETALATARAKLALELDVIAAVGSQGFGGLIFQEILQEIEASANVFLSRIPEVNHLSLKFQIEKETAKGMQRRIVLNTIRRGNAAGNISGSQKTLTALGLDIGLLQVIRQRRGLGQMPGWLILDEPFEGLDARQREEALAVLGTLHGAIIVVDHFPETRGLYGHTVTVELKNGRSRFL